MKKVILMTIFCIYTVCGIMGIEKDDNFKTDFSKYSINLKKVLSGGPGKDGIPPINRPKFTTIKKSTLRDDNLGILVAIDNKYKFYPLNIIVWHEIINDKIADTYFSVTYCPLCGSAIIFNRYFNDKVHSFGVTGYLYESNLLMYDNITESFWSQSLGEAVIGDYTGEKLKIINTTLLEFRYQKKPIHLH